MRPLPGTLPRRLAVLVLVALPLLACACAGPDARTGSSDARTGSSAASGPTAGPSRPAPEARPAALRREVVAAGVLRAWDRRRAAAWESGSGAELRALYTPGAPAAEADVAMLRAWGRRGLSVAGLSTQLLAADVLEWGSGRLRLRVTDRVAYAEAVGRGGRWRLPTDRASAYTVTLERHAGRWLVAGVRDG